LGTLLRKKEGYPLWRLPGESKKELFQFLPKRNQENRMAHYWQIRSPRGDAGWLVGRVNKRARSCRRAGSRKTKGGGLYGRRASFSGGQSCYCTGVAARIRAYGLVAGKKKKKG